MSQVCPACLWISSDSAEACERCGEPFDGRLKPQVSASSIGNVIKTGIGLLALTILGAVAFQRLGGRLPDLTTAVQGLIRSFSTWLLGPSEWLKPFVIAMLVIPLIVLIILWVLARLQ